MTVDDCLKVVDLNTKLQKLKCKYEQINGTKYAMLGIGTRTDNRYCADYRDAYIYDIVVEVPKEQLLPLIQIQIKEVEVALIKLGVKI